MNPAGVRILCLYAYLLWLQPSYTASKQADVRASLKSGDLTDRDRDDAASSAEKLDNWSDPCGACPQLCVRHQGHVAHECACFRGFQTTAGSCQDVDECARDAGLCGPGGRCLNTLGSFVCRCSRGYRRGPAGPCIDVDECADPSNCEHLCHNRPGNFSCSCHRGYTLLPGPGPGRCRDVDECTVGVASCSHLCVNTPGSFVCRCPAPLVLARDGRSCEGPTKRHRKSPPAQRDEAVESKTIIFKDEGEDSWCHVKCLNGGTCREGMCLCPLGLTGPVCQNDVDECLALPAELRCAHRCSNTFGGFQCECRPGWVLGADRRSCAPLDCKPRCHEPATCQLGVCVCPPGADCSTDACRSSPCQQLCRPTADGFTCLCRGRWRLAEDDHSCIAPPCVPHCRNGGQCRAGRCHCQPGFHGRLCQLDVNECLFSDLPCRHACVNSVGSYQCLCPPGLRLTANRTACEVPVQQLDVVIEIVVQDGSSSPSTMHRPWSRSPMAGLRYQFAQQVYTEHPKASLKTASWSPTVIPMEGSSMSREDNQIIPQVANPALQTNIISSENGGMNYEYNEIIRTPYVLNTRTETPEESNKASPKYSDIPLHALQLTSQALLPSHEVRNYIRVTDSVPDYQEFSEFKKFHLSLTSIQPDSTSSEIDFTRAVTFLTSPTLQLESVYSLSLSSSEFLTSSLVLDVRFNALNDSGFVVTGDKSNESISSIVLPASAVLKPTEDASSIENEVAEQEELKLLPDESINVDLNNVGLLDEEYVVTEDPESITEENMNLIRDIANSLFPARMLRGPTIIGNHTEPEDITNFLTTNETVLGNLSPFVLSSAVELETSFQSVSSTPALPSEDLSNIVTSFVVSEIDQEVIFPTSTFSPLETQIIRQNEKKFKKKKPRKHKGSKLGNDLQILNQILQSFELQPGDARHYEVIDLDDTSSPHEVVDMEASTPRGQPSGPPPAPLPQRQLPPSNRAELHCYYDRKKYQSGTSFFRDAKNCTKCVCKDGELRCAPRHCPPPHCESPLTGDCCDFCPGDCVVGQQVFLPGERFNPPLDPCRECRCEAGRAVCRDLKCPALACAPQYRALMPDECCPACVPPEPGCFWQGRFFYTGQLWVRRQGGCHACLCKEGGEVQCNPVVCVVGCQHPLFVAGDCCPLCEGCQHHGKQYDHDQTFPHPSDDCSVCQCQHGNISCFERPCQAECSHPFKPPGRCCPECNDCMFEGEHIPHGSSRSFGSDDSCKECSCKKGVVSCSAAACLASCQVEGGKRVPSGSHFSLGSDACTRCLCQEGHVECRAEPCLTHCSHGVLLPGACCLDCSKCDYQGRIYQELAVFRPTSDQCLSCLCARGNVLCEDTCSGSGDSEED